MSFYCMHSWWETNYLTSKLCIMFLQLPQFMLLRQEAYTHFPQEVTFSSQKRHEWEKMLCVCSFRGGLMGNNDVLWHIFSNDCAKKVTIQFATGRCTNVHQDVILPILWQKFLAIVYILCMKTEVKPALFYCFLFYLRGVRLVANFSCKRRTFN